MSAESSIAALVLALVTLGAIALRTGVRAFRFALTPSLVLVLLGAMLLVAQLAQRQPPVVLLLAGAALTALMLALARTSEMTVLRRMIGRLGHPRLGDRACRYLVAWARAHELAAGRRVDPLHASVVCTAAGAMLGRELGPQAEAVLRTLPARTGASGLDATRASLLAMAHVIRGQHQKARAALAEAPAEVEEEMPARTLRATRALVAAVCGAPDEAEQALGGLAEHAALGGLVLVVEAHVQASRGDEERAVATLGRLRAAGGDEALRRVRDHDGPASALVERLLD
jgi:hypothetical protein